MKYLVIETSRSEGVDFIHFIELRKDVITDEVKYFMNHLDYYKGQTIVRAYFSNSKLTNW